MGIHHSPHTHPTPIPMGIPIPTAALVLDCFFPASSVRWTKRLPLQRAVFERTYRSSRYMV